MSISSINAQKGQVGQTNYAATKSRILGFTNALALESARLEIAVNAAPPGYCDTDMVTAVGPDVLNAIIAAIPVGRLGRPEDVAWMVQFLTRDKNDFITGATFAVNGRQCML